MSSFFPEVGEVFLERYRLDSVLGEGGYARVYRARQLDLGRDVAIKVLLTRQRTAQKAEEAAKRFEREAKLISQLRDPHTITVYDYGATEAGAVFMVVEFVDGRNLFDVIREEGALVASRAASILIQVLYSLHEAHERGVLHRDLKPANIMLYDLPGRPDQVKVLDFGIAKAFAEDGDEGDSMAVALTDQNRVVGSVGYMSPEQLCGEKLGPTSDIYSLGLVAHEMLTGRRAIKGDDDFQAAQEQLQGKAPKLPADLEMPPLLRQTVDAMVQKGADERPQSVAEIIDKLMPLVQTSPTAEATSRRMMYLAVAALVVAAIAAIMANL